MTGETLQNEYKVYSGDMLDIATDIVMALFSQRGAQLDRELAQQLLSNLIMLNTYMKINNKLASYSTIIGFMTQLVQLHENNLDPAVSFS